MTKSRDEDGALVPDTRPGSVPNPDPTALTTKNLQREIFSLRELIETKLAAADMGRDGLRREVTNVSKILETRLDGMDKAIKLLQDTSDKFPARIDEKISALKEVHEQKFLTMLDTYSEKFSSIQTQFKERDVRTEQSSKDSKVAVDAALQAAKEAVGEQNKSSALAIAKSETATAKQIDQQGVLISNAQKTSDDKFNDVKERLTRIEGGAAGGHATWGYIAAGLGILLALATLGGLFFAEKNTAKPDVIYVPAPTGTQLPVTPPAQVPR